MTRLRIDAVAARGRDRRKHIRFKTCDSQFHKTDLTIGKKRAA